MSIITIFTGKSNIIIRNVQSQGMQSNLKGFVIKLFSGTVKVQNLLHIFSSEELTFGEL